MRRKMPLIKWLVQKGFYNHGVKTNFSKLVVDEMSESNERKKMADCPSCYTLICLLCLHVYTNSFFSV